MDEENRPESEDRPAQGAVLPPALHAMLSPEPDTPEPLPPFYMPQPAAPRADPVAPPAEPVINVPAPVTLEPEPRDEPTASRTTPPEPPAVPEGQPDAAADHAPRRRPSPATVAIVLLVIAVLVESVFLFRGNSGDRARTQVLTTARQFVVKLTTYQTSTFEPWRRDILALASGKFRDDFDQLTGPDSGFLQTLRDRQAVSSGTIFRIAIAGVGQDSATVIALVDVSTKNKDLKDPRVEQNVIELSMVETSAGWRIVDTRVLGVVAGR